MGADDSIRLLGRVGTEDAGDSLYIDVALDNGGAPLVLDDQAGSIVFDHALNGVAIRGTAGSSVELRLLTSSGLVVRAGAQRPASGLASLAPVPSL